MSFQLMAWAAEQTTGSPTRKAVLLALANRANHDTLACHPSVERICEETEYGRTAVKDALRELSESGLVKRVRRRRSDGSLGTYSYEFPMYEKPPRGQPRAGDGPSGEESPQTTTGTRRPAEPGKTLDQEQTPEPGTHVARVGAVDGRVATLREREIATAVLVAWNETTGQTLRATTWLRKIIMRIREHPQLDIEQHRAVIDAALRQENRWWKGDPSPSVVYGNDALFERCVMQAAAPARGTPSEEAFEIAMEVIRRKREREAS